MFDPLVFLTTSRSISTKNRIRVVPPLLHCNKFHLCPIDVMKLDRVLTSSPEKSSKMARYDSFKESILDKAKRFDEDRSPSQWTRKFFQDETAEAKRSQVSLK